MTEKKTDNKIYNIEFLRIIGCIVIIVLHLFNSYCFGSMFNNIELYGKLQIMTSNGQKAVDLFFILSGFLFAYKLNTTKTTLDFIKHKIKRFYPVLIFVILLCFIASLFKIGTFNIYEAIITLAGLNGTGLYNAWGTIFVFWYVSSLLFVLTLFYYLLKNYQAKNVNLFIAIGIFFAYTLILSHTNGHIGGKIENINNIFNLGILRAFAGVGIGYFIALWYKTEHNTFQTNCRLKTYLFTICEFCCLFFIINNLMFHKIKYNNDIICIIIFALTLTLFVAKQGYISRILDSSFWAKISKYSYSLFMTHWFVYYILKNTLWKYHKDFVYSCPELQICIALSLVFFLGIATYHFIEVPCNIYKRNERERERVKLIFNYNFAI